MRLSISGLSKRFGPHQVLDRLSLELESVHRLALIGPSGGGKTTLLRILAGLETPEAGEVQLDGIRMRFEEAALLRHRRTVGVVFQAFNLFPHLTALQNITLPLEKVHDYAPAEAREVAMRLLTRFQLATHAAQKPAALSGGQRQRVAIARALAVKPRVLLFDEPTSALDPELVGEVLDVMKNLAGEGMTMLIVTHEMGFAAHVADRIAFIDSGRILDDGPPRRVLHESREPRVKQFLQTYHDRNAF